MISLKELLGDLVQAGWRRAPRPRK